jgi:beta-galactosidase
MSGILNKSCLTGHALFVVIGLLCFTKAFSQQTARTIIDFDNGWQFHLGDIAGAEKLTMFDSNWRKLNLPHDWSIAGDFSKENPATPEGGALPGGIGWYHKFFELPVNLKNKQVYIDFDGVYRKSEVWINGHYLGKRPYGYSSFRYELTPYLNFGNLNNHIMVKVDNADQPNSRWYSGSGIFRNVWLVTTGKIAVDHWGSYITTPAVSNTLAKVNLRLRLRNNIGVAARVSVVTTIYDAANVVVGTNSSPLKLTDSIAAIAQQFTVNKPKLWSDVRPYLYKAVTKVLNGAIVTDTYTTSFGIRYFKFDADKGFFLNGVGIKIRGVCDHHDLGSLGAAINTRALERQLEILKGMGCNAIRTSHNPPAPELLDLCDKMGMIVMDEAFDMWKKQKKPYDYHLDWDEWHERDLQDMVLRDRNHPSVFMWSIGNEIPEQRDATGGPIARELSAIIKKLDDRPVVAGNNDEQTDNSIITSGALDIIGQNYRHPTWPIFHDRFPGKIFIASETTSALETRGYYQMPSDSTRHWPYDAVTRARGTMNADNTVSAYDNTSSPTGTSHEETWKIIKKYDMLSGLFVWTGFDYLGEPTPYSWPSRSSYFGIIDLAGFPKDVYYMYQSEWSNKTVLHIFPHWNWQPGKMVDIWAYYNHAEEVELFLNGKSLGIKKKEGDDLHVMWRVPFEAGTLKAVSRKSGRVVSTKQITTAGAPAKIELTADRKNIKANGKDLCFITVKILDKDGNMVPDADNRVTFSLNGGAFIAGVDNGDPVSHDSFKASNCKAFHGLALAIVQAEEKAGTVSVKATAVGLPASTITLNMLKGK